MNPKRALQVIVLIIVVSCVAAKLRAQDVQAATTSPAVQKGLQATLVPEPKELKDLSGTFAVSGTTKIVVNPAHAQEDHIAAEMLADEIQRATGQKPRVTTGRGAAKGTIYLARLSDDRALRSSLSAKGLSTDDKFDQEGYVLHATRDGVVVAGQSGAGLFYGVQTLRQLVRPDGKGSAIPAVSVKDWPTMRWRGVHDDISRGPVPTLDYMKKQVRTLAEYKINMFSLYIEHVFDYEGEPILAPKEGALNAKEVKELVDYAKKYYVTLVPEQQAFGHLHHVLKTEKFADMAETQHGHVLAPVNEKSYTFINKMYGELVPLFPGPLFHIGADETFELGRGQSEAKVKEAGLGRLYLEHIKKVTEIMKPYNKRLMFWGDIAVHYPELLNILPKDVIAVPWAYSARKSFDSELKPYKDAGLDMIVAPGANNWNMIYPNMSEAFVNIRNFVRDGQKYGAMGVLNTTWDDDGEALFEMTWPALVFGASASWQTGESSIEQFQKDYDWAFYRNQDSTFTDAVMNLNRAHELLATAGAGRANNQAFWADAFNEYGAKVTERALPAAHDLRLSAEAALESLYKYRAKAKDHPETIDAMILAAQRLDLLGMKIQFSAEISRLYWDAYLNMGDRARVGRDLGEIDAVNARLEDLRDATNRVRSMYERAWLAENRPYWLQNVLVRYDVQIQGYQQKINAMKTARMQYYETGALPSPEAMGFYIAPEKPASRRTGDARAASK
jgi:hypothetical protein